MMSDQDVSVADKHVSFFEERTVRWNREKGSIRLIDQSILPLELRFLECNNVEDTIEAIKSLKVRGAPAIGVCGADGSSSCSPEDRRQNKARTPSRYRAGLRCSKVCQTNRDKPGLGSRTGPQIHPGQIFLKILREWITRKKQRIL